MQLDLFHKSLTEKEERLIGLVAKGLPNKAIAHELHLTEGTTKAYLSELYFRLGCDNRTQLALWAVRNDLV